MLAKVLSAAVYGIDANLIDVEVDLSGTVAEQDCFHTVGLPDAAVRESRDRVRAAMKNSGYLIPPTHITINLAPADIKKEGAGFDLPIAIGILSAYGALQGSADLKDFLLVGELGLDGGLRPVPGILPIAVLARARGIDIAIDLAGYTFAARPDLFAARCAATQVSFLGYPGTLGAGFMDYLIADGTVVPREQQAH